MPETFRNYINGEWVDGPTFENRNPANTDELVGLFVKGTAADVDRAADAAQAAFLKWSTMPGPARGALLFKVADILEKKFDQLGEEMCREEGKTLPEAKGEVRRAINIFRYFGSEGSRLPGHLVPSERDRVHMFAIRKPIGVVGLITPWNFPIAIPAWKLAPALVCGNTVILKPASVAPLSAWRIVEACHEAGIPPGVVNFIAGSGGTIGGALVNAKPVKAISFTGSVDIGNWVHTEGSKRHLRLQLEMGGKNPTIVLADCDFNSAVENVVNAAFFSTGQKCTATSRAIVEAPIYDKFVAALVERTKKLKVGNGMEAGIDIGPAVDEGQLETDLKYIAIGRQENGEPLCGGNRLTGGAYDKGYFVEPTVFRGVHNQMRIAQEEIFGPVVCAIPFVDLPDAIAQGNDSPFGLAAGVWTRDIRKAHQAAAALDAGTVWVNSYNAFDNASPWGGFKQSGWGREKGPYGLDLFTQIKSVIINFT